MRSIIALLALTATVFSADPPKIQISPLNKFPNAAVEASPAPVILQPPSGVTVMRKHEVFVFDTDAEWIVLSSPKDRGYFSLRKEDGPMRIRTHFAGEGFLAKDFKGKFIYTVEGVKNGTAELIGIPKGVTEESAIQRRVLQIELDDLIDPAPTPKPKPKPDDPPIDHPKAEQIFVVVVEETQRRTLDIGKVMSDKLWAGLAAKGHAFIHLDESSNKATLDEKNWWPKDKDGNRIPVPCYELLNRTTGERLGGFALKSVADLEAKIKEYTK